MGSEDVYKRQRKRRRDKSRPVVRIPQIERGQLESPFTPLTPLDEEQLEFVHNISLKILEEQGIEVLGDMALDTFRNAGADVSKDGMVRMDRGLVLETIANAPKEFDLVARNPENTIRCGGNAINFGLVSGPPNVHDCINGRRAGNIEDFKKLIMLGQHFNVVTFFGNQAVAPTDLPVGTRHLDTTFNTVSYTHLTLPTKA